MAALELRDANAIDLGTATDFHTLLRAIDETLPHDATLLLEGTFIAAPVAAFLRSHAAPEPREVASFGTPRAPAFHLPLSALRDLRTLAEDHLRSEVATHLAVYREEILLWAPLAGDGVVSLALALPDDTIDAFRTALGPTLRRRSRRRWQFSRARDH
jgi:hypothetical protein